MPRIAPFRIWSFVSIALIGGVSAAVVALGDEVQVLTAFLLPAFVAAVSTTPRRTAVVIALSLAASVAVAEFVYRGVSTRDSVLSLAVVVVGCAFALQTSIHRERDRRSRRRLTLIHSARDEIDAARDLEDDLASFARAAVIGFAEWAFVDIRIGAGEAVRIVCEAENCGGSANEPRPRTSVTSAATSFALRAERDGPVHLENVDAVLLDALFEDVGPKMREGADVIVLPVRAGSVRVTYFLVCRDPHPPWGEAELTQTFSLARAAALSARNDQLIDQLTFAEAELRASHDQIAAIVGGIADGLVAQNADGEMVYVNDVAAEMFGFESADEMIGKRFHDVQARMELRDEAGNPFDPEGLPSRRALRGEERPESMLRYAVKSTGKEWWTLVKARAIFDPSGVPLMAISIIEDLTQHRRRELSHRFLADATKALNEPGDVRKTVASLIEACVPGLADWCAVDLAEPDGDVNRVVLAGDDPSKRSPAPAVAVNVVNTGVPEMLNRSDEERIAQMTGEISPAKSPHAAMIVPLFAQRKAIGAISLALTREGTRFTEYDLETALELGRRAGVSIQEAIDKENRDRILNTLQTSLLPARLPALPGLDVAARFRPAQVDFDVSGDFYDAFTTADGSIAFVIGDVCGKGPDAAAITALARYTIRTEAMRQSEPDELLRTLNRALLEQVNDDRFCTVAVVRISGDASAERVVDVVSGGHPLPLLLHDGKADPIGETGTLLGVVAQPELPVSNTKLAPNESIVLYTDGLSAGSTTDDVGFAISMLEGVSAGSADELADALDVNSLAKQSRPSRDDVAIMVIRAV